jgi:hypothetical protein
MSWGGCGKAGMFLRFSNMTASLCIQFARYIIVGKYPHKQTIDYPYVPNKSHSAHSVTPNTRITTSHPPAAAQHPPPIKGGRPGYSRTRDKLLHRPSLGTPGSHMTSPVEISDNRSLPYLAHRKKHAQPKTPQNPPPQLYRINHDIIHDTAAAHSSSSSSSSSVVHLPPLHHTATGPTPPPPAVALPIDWYVCLRPVRNCNCTQTEAEIKKKKKKKTETNVTTANRKDAGGASSPAITRLPGGLLRRAQQLSKEHAELERKLSDDYNKKTATRVGQLTGVSRALKDYEDALNVPLPLGLSPPPH